MTPMDATGDSAIGDAVDVPGWVQDVSLLDAIAAAVVATDTTGKIFYFNRAAERFYGYSADDMLGANVMQLFVEPLDQMPAEEIMATVLAGNRWSGHLRVADKQVTRSWCVSLTPDPGGWPGRRCHRCR